MSFRFGLGGTIFTSIGVAAAAQIAYLRNERHRAGGDAGDDFTSADASGEVDTSKLTPATTTRTFAQCISKQELSKSTWTRTSFDVSAKCGEDSFFVADDFRTFGVADGVGGWSRHGVNPKDFSEKLVNEIQKHVTELQGPSLKRSGKAVDLAKAVAAAHTETKKAVSSGSSTCCCGTLDATTGKLHTFNLGDSGLMVVRGRRAVFVADETSHGFNFPMQLGVNKGKAHGDAVTDASRQAVQVFRGDMVVVASDGVFDNVEVKRIARLVGEANGDAAKAAHMVLEAACEGALRGAPASDHSGKPKTWSEGGVGGKPDDITVLVSRLE